MPHERIILCLNCGQQNRLKSETRFRSARCGRCEEPLTPAQKGMRGHSWVSLLLVAASVIGYLAYSNHPSSLSTPDRRQQAPVEPPIPAPEESLPEAPTIPRPKLKPALPVAISTGLVRARPGRKRIAPLEIRTASGHNYFVKLMNLADGKEELAIYIEGGSSFTIDMPLGTYELYYDAGEIWYGEAHRFGPETASYKAEKQFTFYREGDSISGYTIELILQIGGNLRVTRIDPSRS